MPKVILTTGGTGGHIFPALAVGEALVAKGVELLFIGATYGPEADYCKRAGVEFLGLPARGFLGRGLKALPAAFALGRSLGMAIRAIRNYRPCAVAAFGGYASLAPALAALILRIPLLIHEQNAIAGASNRILARFAAARCASVPGTSGLGDAAVITGNPVRSFLAGREKPESAAPHLLVLGGSQGAHSLNEAMIRMLPALKKAGIEIRHQTGPGDLARVRKAYAENGLDPEIAQAFIYDMAEAYSWADLALCRAGASTLAELNLTGLPALLVPFPAAIHDHQTLNARAMANAGAAILLPEDELGQAEQMIPTLIRDKRKLAQMSESSAALAKPDAAKNVAEEILKLCR